MIDNIVIKAIDHSDRRLWDAFVETNALATPYHSFAWSMAVSSAYKFEAIYLAAFIDEGIVGILPLIKMRSLAGSKQLCSLPYCDIGGACADDDMVIKALEAFAIQLAKQQAAELILRSYEEKVLPAEEAPENTKVRMLLKLPDTADALMNSFKSKLRSQIRKAEKNGLTSKILKSPFQSSDIKDFYQVISENMRDLGSPVHSFTWYENILKHFDKNCFLSLVFAEQEVVGAGLVIKNGQGAVIPWASTRKEFNRLAPNMLLYWSVLSECAESGVDTFDFGRSTVGEGTFKFKKQWGCDAQILKWEVFKNGHAMEATPSKPSTTRKTIENIWQKIPLPVANAIGPKIRRHINL